MDCATTRIWGKSDISIIRLRVARIGKPSFANSNDKECYDDVEMRLLPEKNDERTRMVGVN